MLTCPALRSSISCSILLSDSSTSLFKFFRDNNNIVTKCNLFFSPPENVFYSLTSFSPSACAILISKVSTWWCLTMGSIPGGYKEQIRSTTIFIHLILNFLLGIAVTLIVDMSITILSNILATNLWTLKPSQSLSNTLVLFLKIVQLLHQKTSLPSNFLFSTGRRPWVLD